MKNTGGFSIMREAAATLTIERELLPGGVVLLRLAGTVDARTFEQLEMAVQDILARGGNKLIVDLSQVHYLSSAGIGIFMHAMSEARSSGGELVLLALTPAVAEIFESLHLSPLFRIAKNRAEALAGFDRPR